MDICRQAVLSTLRCSCRSRSWGCWALPENGEDLTLCILVCSNLVEWSALSEQRSTANSSLQRLKAELQGKDNKKNAIWNDSGGIGIFVITIYTSYHKLLSNSNTSGNQPCGLVFDFSQLPSPKWKSRLCCWFSCSIPVKHSYAFELKMGWGLGGDPWNGDNENWVAIFGTIQNSTRFLGKPTWKEKIWAWAGGNILWWSLSPCSTRFYKCRVFSTSRIWTFHWHPTSLLWTENLSLYNLFMVNTTIHKKNTGHAQYS